MRTLAQRISAHLNRRSAVYLVLFSALYFVRAAAEASVRPMWHDELFTAYLLRVPTAGDLWAGLASGIDLMPPLYHLILRVLEPVLGSGPVVLRLPSMVGFWVMCLCLYRYVSYRLPAEFGFAAMLLPFCTQASQYMTEARPYGLVLGLGALALVSWQALERRSRLRPVWLVSLAVALGGAISAHYFAVFLVLPLAVGEMVRTARRRSMDWVTWASLTGPLVVLLPLLPLLRVAREFAPTFWTLGRIGETVLVYNSWLGQSDWVFVALLALVALTAWVDRSPDVGRASRPPAADLVPAAVLLALPAIGAAAAYIMSAGFIWRYVLPGILGFAILSSYGLARVFGHSHVLRLLMLGVLSLNHEAVFETRDLLTAAPRSVSAQVAQKLLALGDSEVPVFVTSPHGFLELYYYAPSDLSRRVRYAASPELAIREFGSDTADRALILLARVVPLPVGVYPDALPDAGYYLVDAEPLNWLVRELVTRQARLTLVSAGDFAIYRVEKGKR